MKKRVAIAFVLLLFAVLLFAGAYRAAGEDRASFTLTQYPQQNGAQGLCYILTDAYDHMIFIDGGWDTNAELLLNRIMEHGNYVDAWIITHSHEDHVSAFNNLSSGPFDFQIGTIYCPDLDEEHYRKVADAYDGGFEHYLAFRRNLERWENVRFVHAGEEYDLFGLRMKIFNAYEKGDPAFEQDPENTGSLMFKLEGKKTSALFCADVTKKRARELKKQYGEELKADILQVGHHGIGWCPDNKFNLFIEPETVFFDAPGSLISGSGESLKALQELADTGAVVYTFDTAPNSVILR